MTVQCREGCKVVIICEDVLIYTRVPLEGLQDQFEPKPGVCGGVGEVGTDEGPQ